MCKRGSKGGRTAETPPYERERIARDKVSRRPRAGTGEGRVSPMRKSAEEGRAGSQRELDRDRRHTAERDALANSAGVLDFLTAAILFFLRMEVGRSEGRSASSQQKRGAEVAPNQPGNEKKNAPVSVKDRPERAVQQGSVRCRWIGKEARGTASGRAPVEM